MLQPLPAVSEQMATAREAVGSAFDVAPGAARGLFRPYRLVPLGAHVDHQGGAVLGRTISAGTALAYMPLEQPEVRLLSGEFDDTVVFTLGDPVQPGHWGRYAQAAALALATDHTLTCGLAGVVLGLLLGAGLGSSASVGLAYLSALADVNGLTLSDCELVALDYRLEHDILGLDNGIADQSVILLGADDALTRIDTRHRAAERVPDPPAVAGTGWLVADSGVRRELTAGSAFNQRVAECRAAAQWLDPAATVLSDVPAATFAARATDMPDPLRGRAAHYYGEQTRVAEGAAAWAQGDVAAFGRLMDDSCRSSIEQYGSGHRATIALHNLMSGAPGVYGSRFSGGGYGGCVVGLVEGSQADEAAAFVLNEYRQQFPDQARDAAVYWAPNGGGAA